MSDSWLNVPGRISSTLHRCRFSKLAPVLLFLSTVISVGPAAAENLKFYEYEGQFADAAFDVESAIVDRGLVIDYVSHVGEMLKRTKDDVGGSKDVFENADIYLFCSAVLSREVMEADPANIAHCPYKVFVTENAGGEVQVGYQIMPDGPMKKVEALLDDIARGATGN
ncbi:DUF302 domain-containing protein [Hwanghaeella sp.]|uniref:DUF302 domain-containing protein n=1 Tax=Hwanghaeella sp. TaxID=2605943 RepID=UPI003CCC06E9